MRWRGELDLRRWPTCGRRSCRSSGWVRNVGGAEEEGFAAGFDVVDVEGIAGGAVDLFEFADAVDGEVVDDLLIEEFGGGLGVFLADPRRSWPRALDQSQSMRMVF